MHAINWFEIPCHDLERAARFYERVLGVELTRTTFMGVPHGIFPGEPEAVRGALVLDRQNAPSAQGARVYLDATGKLDTALARAAELGGEVVQPKTAIGPQGFIGIIRDTEGNRIGLHSKP